MSILNFRDAGGGMKQPEDTRTIELPGLDLPTRRGRGRPRKPDALTPAQRAKRYRDRQKAAAAARRRAQQGDLIRYRGPGGETWTGRGRQPLWVDHYYRLGWSLDDLEQLGDGP